MLELLDRAVDEHLRRALGAAQRLRDLAVVHSERETHDQGLPAIIGQGPHPLEDGNGLLAPDDQVLGVVERRQLHVLGAVVGLRLRSR